MPNTSIPKHKEFSDSLKKESNVDADSCDRKDQTDLRELLVNQGDIGLVHEIAVSEDQVGQINGIGFDLDRKLMRSDGPFCGLGEMEPEEAYQEVVQGWLMNHPVLAKSEVRMSGGGLHLILWLDEPIILDSCWQLDRWIKMIKVIQASLPIDPDQPGILMMTRPIDSVNSKNGKVVTQLKESEPVTQDEIESFVSEMMEHPFKTVMQILFGSERRTPCPICGKEETHLSAGRGLQGHCYNECGKVSLGDLYSTILLPREIRKGGTC